MQKFINTYNGGMNKDLSPNKYPNINYLDLKDFRIITTDEDGLTNGALTNVKGNSLAFTVPNSGVVLGHTVLRDYLYILTKNPAGTDPDRIYRIPLEYLGNSYIDWFLPSLDELFAMYDELFSYSVGSFSTVFPYWSSSEYDATAAYTKTFDLALPLAYASNAKNRTEFNTRPCRAFSGSAVDYPLRSVGPAGGLIFYNTGGTIYEAYPEDIALGVVWSNINSVAITGTGTAIGTGVTNTAAIISQSGHTSSVSAACDIIETAQAITLTGTYYFQGLTYADALIYKGDLGFDTDYKIRVLGNYENSNVQKLYWIDGLNGLKHINTIYNATTNDLENLDEELLKILPNHTYGTFDLTIQTGGILKSGKVQYAYQLYSVNGTETLYSIASPLLNLTDALYPISDSNDFYGSDIESNTNKSVAMEITLTADYVDFNRIRIVALDYVSYALTPTVRIVVEKELTGDTVYLTDYGYSIGTIALEEFQLLRNDIIPLTLDSKNNYLIAGNITQEFFDVDAIYTAARAAEVTPTNWMTYLDTKAYRWRFNGGASLPGVQRLTEVTDPVAAAETPNAFPLTFDSFVSSLSHIWELNIMCDPEGHAAGLGYDFVNMVTSSISLLNAAYLEITIAPNGGGSDTCRIDLTSMTSVIYTTGNIQIIGTDMVVGYEPLADYDVNSNDDMWVTASNSGIDATTMHYQYNYTAAGAATLQCLVDQGLATERIVDDGVTLNYETVEENHAARNLYNDISNDIVETYQYKYINGAAAETFANLGGTGPLISYSFAGETFDLGTTYLETAPSDDPTLWKDNAVPESYMNPSVASLKVGYARDEVYRFAIVFFDLKGRASFAKWIGDIRMPDWEVSNFMSSALTGNILYINFVIDWTALPTGFKDQISGVRFVRVHREDNDKTIKGVGIINPMFELTNINYTNPFLCSSADYNAGSRPADLSGGTMNQTLFDFISPTVAFNKQITTSASGFLEVIGNLGDITQTDVDHEGTIGNIRRWYNNVLAENVVFGTMAVADREDIRGVSTDTLLSLPEPRDAPTYSVGGDTYAPEAHDFQADAFIGYKGTTLVVKTAAIFDVTKTPATATAFECLYGNYRVPLGTSIYGGNSFENRAVNVYTPCSEFILTGTTGDLAIYGGDTFINMFQYLYAFINEEETGGTNRSIQSYLTFPVESPINISYRRDLIQKYLTWQADRIVYSLAEFESIGISQYGETYPSVGDLYRYNSVYSAPDRSHSYVPKPFDFVATVTNDVSVTSSDLKFAGEYSDSWLQFRYNNYLEVESRYGAITRLISQDNRLLCIQPQAISLLSVLEREQVQTNNTASLAVGTGGVLSRYDYLTTTSGASFHDGIVPTEAGLYYYDDKNKNIRRLEQMANPISDIKGMKSYVSNKNLTDIIATYDRDNREVLFAGTDADDGALDVLRYNGLLDFFEGSYGYNPSTFISYDRKLLSSADNNTFYLHHVGAYGVYYDQATPESSTLTIIINPAQGSVGTLHILEWLTSILNGAIEQQTTTFTSIRVQNTYQDTGVVPIVNTTNIMRRLRTWRMNILRDSLSNSGRLRDSYFKVTLTYDNANNYKMIAHDIISSISPTKIR